MKSNNLLIYLLIYFMDWRPYYIPRIAFSTEKQYGIEEILAYMKLRD